MRHFKSIRGQNRLLGSAVISFLLPTTTSSAACPRGSRNFSTSLDPRTSRGTSFESKCKHALIARVALGAIGCLLTAAWLLISPLPAQAAPLPAQEAFIFMQKPPILTPFTFNGPYPQGIFLYQQRLHITPTAGQAHAQLNTPQLPPPANTSTASTICTRFIGMRCTYLSCFWQISWPHTSANPLSRLRR